MACGDEPAAWTNVVGASPSGSTLTKTGSNVAWDAGAASANIIRDGFGYVEFTKSETSYRIMAGLSNGDAGTDYPDVDFAFHTDALGNVHIFEAGTYRGQFGTYAAGDRFRVEVLYGVVRYLKNSTLLYTSTVQPTYPLRVDAELYDPGAAVTDVRVGHIAWTNVVSSSIAGSTITKSGSSGWTSGAISANTIESGDGAMEFTATETNTTRVAGLSSGDSSQSWNDVDYGIELRDDGVVEVVEAGTSRGTYGSYSASDRFRVEVRAGVVTYSRSGTLLYTSAVAPTYPLRIDTALNTAGATLTDLTLTPLVWASASGVTATENSLAKTAADGWNAVAKTSFALAGGDGYLEFKAIETDKRRAVGLRSGSGTASSYADLDYAIDLGATGTITVYEAGVSRGTFGSYAHGDRFRIELEEGAIRYRKDGAILYSSTVAPSYPIHGEATLYTSGATVADVMAGEESWLSPTGVAAMGSSLVKTGTQVAWDAEALSTRAFNSGAIEFTASQSDRFRHIGLTHGDTGTDYTDLDFAIHLNDLGQLHVFEGSNHVGSFGTYAPGDRFRVEVASGVVRYLKNGSVFHTSTLTPTLPLRPDVNIASPGASVLNVHIEGEPVTETLEAPMFSPGTGTYSTLQTVTITALIGATIRYTSEGTDPTESSTTYAGALSIDQTTTLKAKAWKPGYQASAVAVAAIVLRVPTPSLSAGTGGYTTPQSVVITETLSGADLHYTTNGTDPTQSDSTIASGSSVSISSPATLKVAAWKSGWTRSDIAAASYTFQVATPTLIPAAGGYTGALPVTVATTSPGATLRYRLDGQAPTESDPEVASGSAVTVSHSATLKVRGWRSTWTPSATAAGTYWIGLGTVADPVLTPAPGTFTSAQVVVISTSTTGATIRYTLDGTEPGLTSPIYSTPVIAAATASIRAKAFKSDMTPSTAAGGLYVIDTGTVDPPRFSPARGRYPTFRDVVVTSETAGATIHYTTNGQEPTESDPVVASGGTVHVAQTLSLRAKAWKTGLPASDVSHAEYAITGATAVGAGFSLALKGDGTVWVWGQNSLGVFGDPGVAWSTVWTSPGQVPGLTDVVAIDAYSFHCLALRRDGTVWFWGQSTSTVSTPTQVSGLSGIVAIATGEQHLALRADGTLYRWGLEFGSDTGSVSALTGVTGVARIAAAAFYLALKTDGAPSGGLWSWGRNDVCLLLADGGCDFRTTPGLVPLANVTEMTAGGFHGHAETTSGDAWGWGLNNSGAVGDQTAASRATPVLISTSLRPSVIADGVASSYAVAPNGQVWSWGSNAFGALGMGDAVDYNLPTPTSMRGAISLSAGASASHVLVLKADGTAWSWGANGSGQLGDGTTTNRVLPVQVAGLETADNSAASDDADADGLDFEAELAAGTDPFNVDTNGDGIPDGAAVSAGKSASNLDMDGDGVLNSVEVARGTDPFRADTDGDGEGDATDCFPLDPARSTCPSSDPNDHTPPVITLTEPTSATLVSSVPPQ